VEAYGERTYDVRKLLMHDSTECFISNQLSAGSAAKTDEDAYWPVVHRVQTSFVPSDVGKIASRTPLRSS